MVPRFTLYLRAAKPQRQPRISGMIPRQLRILRHSQAPKNKVTSFYLGRSAW